MRWILAILAVLFILFAGYTIFTQTKPGSNPTPIPTPSTLPKEINIKASFTVITGNITRSFTASKYHNKSADVYIQNPDPSIVNVKKPGTTWDDFFKTLPMKLTNECLTTGDGENYCQKDGSLEFYLNDTKDQDVLNKEIRDGDKLLVKFTF